MRVPGCDKWRRVYVEQQDGRVAWTGTWERDCGDGAVGADVRSVARNRFAWAVYEGTARDMPVGSGEAPSAYAAKRSADDLLVKAVVAAKKKEL